MATSTQAKVFCIYCGAEDEKLTLSEMAPDDLLYPGPQRICKDHAGCMKRIHDRYHQDMPCEDCPHCI